MIKSLTFEQCVKFFDSIVPGIWIMEAFIMMFGAFFLSIVVCKVIDCLNGEK